MKACKKIVLALLTILFFISLLGMISCNIPSENNTDSSSIQQESGNDFRKVYSMYVVYAESQGVTPLSYEAWLFSIRGEKGDDGLTPYIGSNGNWWIGDNDTGVKASGEKGETGEQGVGIKSITVNEKGELIITLTDNTVLPPIQIPNISNEDKPSANLQYQKIEGKEEYRLLGVGLNAERNIVIPDTYDGLPITEIATSAFENLTYLESVKIGENVNTIGDSAFAGCGSLRNVVIPKSVNYIGNNAFDLVKTYEDYIKCAFTDVYYTGTIDDWVQISFANEFSNPLLSLDFYGLNDSSYIYYPKRLIIDGEIVKEITVTSNKINDLALASYMWLTDIRISNDVTSIGSAAFAYCENLTSVVIGNSVGSIGDGAFGYCNKLASIEIPDSVTSIGSAAFEGCIGLTSVEIGDSVVDIGSSAFADCSSLVSVVLGDSVAYVDSSAFTDCSSLVSIVIPDSLTTFGSNAFYNCTALSEVHYLGTVEQWGNIEFENLASNPTYYSKALIINGEIIDVPIYDGSFDYTKMNYDGSAVTIRFYHTMGQTLRGVLDKYITIFNQVYPNITIEHEQVGGYDEVRDRIITDIQVGNAPNLAYCYPEHVARYNADQATQSLDDLINNVEIGLTAEQIADFIPAYYEEGKQFGDGKMYTMPFSKSTEVLYYNKTFFDAHGLCVPTTWEEMEAVCRQIKAIDPTCIPLGYDSEANWFITMCEQLGSPYTSATAPHYLFDNPANHAFIKEFREWYQEGLVITQELYGAYTSSLFVSDYDQRCYMCIASSAGALHQRPGPYTVDPFEVGITSIPQVNANNKKIVSQGPSLCIFKQGNPQEVIASWLFVKFLTTSPDFQAEFSMASGYIPVIKSASQNEAYATWLESADGGDNILALSCKIGLAQTDCYYSSPAFIGASIAREKVAQLLIKCLSEENVGDVDTFIASTFAAAVEECEYAG